MKVIKLTAEEQEIEDNLELVWKKNRLTAQSKHRYEETARSSLAVRVRKEARVNLRMTENDVLGLKKQAELLGIPYQTLAVAVLKRVAQGKIALKFVEN